MRRATPPWVRKLPARMKNGIAMISNFSMPVNSFSATASIGTWVMVNRKVSTVRPSAIEIGMPVSISTISSAKMMTAFMRVLALRLAIARGCRRRRVDLSMPSTWPGHGAAARRCARRTTPPAGSESTSGTSRAEWPGRPIQHRQLRDPAEHLARCAPISQTNFAPRVPTMAVNSAPPSRPNDDELARAQRSGEPVDQDVDADVDAGAHAVGGAELRHPHEHVDAQLLRPADRLSPISQSCTARDTAAARRSGGRRRRR